jgi:PKD repeat protein
VLSDFDFFAQSDDFRIPASITFQNHSNNAADYYWNFGDGSYSYDENPKHVYNYSGIYTVSLKALCSNAVFDVWTKKIEILPPPAIIAITGIKYWFPTSFIPERTEDKTDGLDIYIDFFYNGSLKGSSVIAWDVQSSPFSFVFPTNLTSGTHKITGVNYSSGMIDIEIWDADDGNGNKDDLLWKIELSPHWLMDNGYPGAVTFEQNGMKAMISLVYFQ